MLLGERTFRPLSLLPRRRGVPLLILCFAFDKHDFCDRSRCSVSEKG
jgi:hypothetical protein